MPVFQTNISIILSIKMSFSLLLHSCTFEDDCPNSDWLSIPDDSQQKMVSYKVMKDSTGQVEIILILKYNDNNHHVWLSVIGFTLTSFLSQVTLNIHTHLTVGRQALDKYSCNFSTSSSDFIELCRKESPFPKFPQCTCILSNSSLPAEGQWLLMNILMQWIKYHD